MRHQKGNIIKPIIAATLFLAVIVLLAYFFYQQYYYRAQEGELRDNNQSVRSQSVEVKQVPVQNTLSDNEYGFSLKYPSDFFDPGHEPKILTGDCNYDVFPSACPNINDMVIKDLILKGGDANVIEENLSSPGYWENPDGKKLMVNSVDYCLYRANDAAMGRVYNYYYYVTVKNKKCFVVNFGATTAKSDFYFPLSHGNIQQEKNYHNCLAADESQLKILDQIIHSFTFAP